jgi:hypothetical protein
LARGEDKAQDVSNAINFFFLLYKYRLNERICKS